MNDKGFHLEITKLAEGRTIPMILFCPNGHRHIDEQDFAEVAHHTHACQECGIVWRPAKVNTHGVRFLPGYKNLDAPSLNAGDRVSHNEFGLGTLDHFDQAGYPVVLFDGRRNLPDEVRMVTFVGITRDELKPAYSLAPGDDLNDAMDWLIGEPTLGLSFHSPTYSDNGGHAREWSITKVSGPINDREWHIVGRGETALEAITAARAALITTTKADAGTNAPA